MTSDPLELGRALARIPAGRRWQLRRTINLETGERYTCQIFGLRDARLVDGAGASRDPVLAVTKALQTMGNRA